VHATFRQLRADAGLKPRSPACRPRIHDLRHRFAVQTLLDWYRDGIEVQARLPLLSTYLGHYAERSVMPNGVSLTDVLAAQRRAGV